jgi:hypothetical protein
LIAGLCPAFPLLFPVGPGGGGWFQAGAGGPVVAVNSRCQAAAQGQAVGSRSVLRRAERVTRAATLINCRRTVAVVALAWKLEASAPAARVRHPMLNGVKRRRAWLCLSGAARRCSRCRGCRS